MRILKHPFFISISGLAISVYMVNLIGLKLPFALSFYLNDLLCMPLVLSLSLAIMRRIKKNNHIYIPNGAIVFITLYYALHFEWLLPKFMARYTSDPIDVGLYFTGALIFYVLQKRLF